MSIPYDRLGIPVPLRRSVSPEAPASAKIAVAKGLLPTTADVQLALLYVLVVDKDEKVSSIARDTLINLPSNQILSAIGQQTFPKILEFIAEFRTVDREIDERIIHIRGAPTRAAVRIAERADAELCEVLTRHQERLLLSPAVYVALHANENCSNDDLGRAEAFLRMHKSMPEVPDHRPFEESPAEETPEPVAAPEPAALEAPPPSALTPEPAGTPLEPVTPVAMQPAQTSTESLKMFDLDQQDSGAPIGFEFDFSDDMENFSWDLTGDEDDPVEEEEDEFLSVEKRIAKMSVGEKIKLAYLGNKQARSLLVRDSNKIVAAAVVKSGRLTPAEVANYAGNRNLADDVLREISSNSSFTRKYPVKVALVNNPKTPVSVAISFIHHLQKRDLQHLSNNRNVPSVIFGTAKQLFKEKYRK